MSSVLKIKELFEEDEFSTWIKQEMRENPDTMIRNLKAYFKQQKIDIDLMIYQLSIIPLKYFETWIKSYSKPENYSAASNVALFLRRHRREENNETAIKEYDKHFKGFVEWFYEDEASKEYAHIQAFINEELQEVNYKQIIAYAYGCEYFELEGGMFFSNPKS